MLNMPMQEIIWAAVLAFFCTSLINIISKMFVLIAFRPTIFNYNPCDKEKVLKKCNHLFSKEVLQFNDNLFRRGMQVRVFTFQQKTIVGEFVGVKNDRMICLITNRHIVTHALNNIMDILPKEY